MTTPSHSLKGTVARAMATEAFTRGEEADRAWVDVNYPGGLAEYVERQSPLYLPQASTAISAITSAGFAIVEADALRMANSALATHGLAPLPTTTTGDVSK